MASPIKMERLSEDLKMLKELSIERGMIKRTATSHHRAHRQRGDRWRRKRNWTPRTRRTRTPAFHETRPRVSKKNSVVFIGIVSALFAFAVGFQGTLFSAAQRRIPQVKAWPGLDDMVRMAADVLMGWFDPTVCDWISGIASACGMPPTPYHP